MFLLGALAVKFYVRANLFNSQIFDTSLSKIIVTMPQFKLKVPDCKKEGCQF